MICIAGNLPVIQVGRHQVCGYDTEFIRNGLLQAAVGAGRSDFPFLDDVYDSILHYLEFKCPLRLLPNEKLNERISYMLKRIGCEHIARALPKLAPSITISLEEAAINAGDSYELGFFTNLKTEIQEARSTGAEAVVFEDVKSSVCILTKREEWDEKCEVMEKEILRYLTNLGVNPKRQAKGRRIHVPLNSVASEK